MNTKNMTKDCKSAIIIAPILLAVVFVCFMPINALAITNQNPYGQEDVIDANGNLSGWACDPDNFAQPLTIHFYVDGKAPANMAGPATANLGREAGVGAMCGGYSAHGFSFPIPDKYKDGQTHTIYAFAINTPDGYNPELLNTQTFSFSCAPSGLSAQLYLQTSLSNQGSREYIHIVNNGPCSYPVTFVSYKMFDLPPKVSTQQVFDSVSTTIGSHQTIDLSVAVPNCASQVDLWYATPPYPMVDGFNYFTNHMVIDGILLNSSNLCFVAACNTNSDCGTSGNVGSPFCQGNAVYQNYKTYTCNNPGTASASCANSTAAQLVANCTASQTCQNAQCVNLPVTCSTNSQCGTNGYVGDPFCQNGNVFQNYKTYICNNPGTPSATCTNSINAQLKQACSVGQTCSNGICMPIACSLDSNCGNNSLTGNPFCQGNNVFRNQITYHCNNPGTTQSFCSNTLVPQLTQACGTNQTCNNGSCASQNIACGSNADCGSNGLTGNAFCQGNNVYKNYITYSCNNPGTNQSFCSNSTTPQLTQTCSPNQQCINGSCVAQNIACNTNSDCGTSGNVGSPFCQGNAVYINYKAYTCNNPGTINSSCTNSTTAQLLNNCSAGQTCSSGSCMPVACSTNSQCGTNGYVGDPFCQGDSVYRNYKTYTCNNPGTSNSTCTNSTVAQLQQACNINQTCSNGTCQNNNLVVSCYATPNPANTNQQVSFIANAVGGTGSYTYSWSGACTGSSMVCLNSFTQSGNKNATVYVTSGTQTISAVCSVNVAQPCTSHASQKCVGNNVYWFDSCNNQQELSQQCTTSQTCQNAQCVNLPVTCSYNSDCGINGNIGSPFCQGNAVYQNYKTYTCNNPGTPNSTCTNSTNAQLVNTCSTGQVCSSGSCANVRCNSNSDCGANGNVGSPYCQQNAVYTNYKTYTCNNPGTISSTCTDSTAPVLTTTCTSTQTCSNGTCTNVHINCNTNSDCGNSGLVGSPFCQGNAVYQNYKTYTCNNPGTVNSSCSDTTTPQLQQTCNSTQTCSGGSCQNNNLVVSCNASPNPANTNQQVSFIANAVGGTGSFTYSWSGACSSSSQTCSNSFSQSGTQTATVNVTSGTQTNSATCSVSVNTSCTSHSSQKCVGNNVYWFDSCNTQQDLIQYCPDGCSNGSCIQQNISVQTNSATNIANNQATLNGYLYQSNNNNNAYVWFQWGTSTSYGSETTHQSRSYTGQFNQDISNLSTNTTYHFRAVAQANNGNLSYGQDMTFSTGTSGQALLTVSKTARNMSSGNLGWSNTIYANPSDVVMFMITLQTTGNQSVNNVMVRDTFPYNLIYKNQLVVSGSNNYYNNYSGDITSGITFGTISAGQTITITYQAQLASAQNFSYGTSTLNNSVSVTSSNTGYTPTSNASVIVTRTAVYAASAISTGLTNNLLTDSLLLPLALAMLGILLFKSGLLLGFERWLVNSKTKYVDYKAQKELKTKISQIRRREVA